MDLQETKKDYTNNINALLYGLNNKVINIIYILGENDDTFTYKLFLDIRSDIQSIIKYGYAKMYLRNLIEDLSKLEDNISKCVDDIDLLDSSFKYKLNAYNQINIVMSYLDDLTKCYQMLLLYFDFYEDSKTKPKVT